jgi:hypothetical protein
MRFLIGKMLIKAGIAVLPCGVRETVRGLLLYHVPGALTEAEKEKVRAVAAAARL